MYNHEPKDYVCPFCQFASGEESDDPTVKQAFVVRKTDFTTAFINSAWWPNNLGHVLVIPNTHFENIYDIPDDILGKVYAEAKQMALALKKVYKCDGTSMRQHNEPDGSQSAWHFHVHVFPRYKDDNLYINHNLKKEALEKDRIYYASLLKDYFKEKV